MLRKLSTFRKDRKKSLKGTNRIIGEKDEKAKSSHIERIDESAERAAIHSHFKDFAQIINVSRQPVPDQSGDGTYMEKEETTGLFADMKNLGFKDLKTLREVLGNRASGELVDDKTYIMERVIQVGLLIRYFIVA